MLNNIPKHGVSKGHSVKIENSSGATAERINDEVDDTFHTNFDISIIYAGTNDLSAKIIPLKKILEKSNELSEETKLVFWNVTMRKNQAINMIQFQLFYLF